MSYSVEGGRIVKAIGPTWCFTHGQAMPCATCATIKIDHPFEGRCFDCKREFCGPSEIGEPCSCAPGTRVRAKGFYGYP